MNPQQTSDGANEVRVGKTDLRNRIKYWAKRADARESIVVTDRGTPVARLHKHVPQADQARISGDPSNDSLRQSTG